MHIKVSGIGLTQFGELWEKSLSDLFAEVVESALEDAKMDPENIDQIYVGSMLSGETSHQSHLGSLFSSLYGVNTPGIRIEGACASGGLAIFQAVQALQSGNCKTVLVVGIEKMTDFSADEIAHFLMQAASEEERLSGATFPSLYAMMAKAHMDQFGTRREDLAAASVLAHRNALKNPLAQFHKSISIDDVLQSNAVCSPLNLLDCSPITDGAAAIILTNEAPKNIPEAFLLAQSCATDTISLSDRASLTELKATKIASQKLFAKTGLSPKDIDILEIHDCFSIATLFALEDIGFVEKGEGGKALQRILQGDLEGLPALNTSGGLKACGHPVGATGVKQVAEIALHLREKAEDRQLKRVKYGLTQNVGGTGATCVMHLLGSSEVIVNG